MRLAPFRFGFGGRTRVRAAGGVIIRDGAVLLVYREVYDDWAFPKGKLDPGESWQVAAIREVEEEAGLACTIVGDAGRTFYVDGNGRQKEVRYYRMTAAGDAQAQNEIDAVRWVPIDEAMTLLSYPRDRELLSRLR
ncbi:unannotated protein [freshwater metagenome]|uniref:Unannotated protein n=1 Tax=freshwater metagenome TaxID=449393 RepID=A0A6J6PHU9_9ZZZZ